MLYQFIRIFIKIITIFCFNNIIIKIPYQPALLLHNQTLSTHYKAVAQKNKTTEK